ncbi:TRAP transporter large permease [Azospira restricta]|uniref:TRAP transporter large permease protein n=1 Tax=Azospira restricta TaxID=404405 RepID=A0A974PX54_9RHOO|nr:TRAP transporter large permease subunit [Azospira restricta]QRJ63107.1 TRAP transporter large permease subunit [Azospira restricta]
MIATALLMLLALMALAIPVGAALGLLGVALDWKYAFLPLTRALGEVAWNANNEFLLVCLPFFIMLGEILLRSGIAEKMYAGLVKWMSWLPGGLMHANIASCALFAATSGSSVATAATVGTVALPQAKRFGYNERLFLGTLAAGGTLGILIPPSLNMIIYCVLTNTSVPKLYLAGIVPGLVLVGLFMGVVWIGCLVFPQWGGEKTPVSWSERLAVLPDLLPPLGIFLVVVGSIYVGIATATEASALGVAAALGLAAWTKHLSWKMLGECLEGTMKSTGMVMLIIVAAMFLNFVINSIGLTDAMTQAMQGLNLSPAMMLLVVVVFYLVLGCFMETMSMMITTIPIVAPVMFALGFDPIWFGVVIVVLVEAALITPPVGLNLFVVQNLRKGGTLNDVIAGTSPFVVALMVLLLLLALFPGLAMWLPTTVVGGQ